MNRLVQIRLKWLGGALLVLGSGGCITYSGEYANDGYYGSPDTGNAVAYGSGYYGDYYYSAVPTINISYNLFFGYPLYGYAGCRYWSPYCSLFYPGYGYGYGYGPGYGFGWGHPPYYGYQPPHRPHPKPKPRPPNEQHNPPPTQQPIVRGRPIRALPGNQAHPTPQAPQQAATAPVSTGTRHPALPITQPAVEAPAVKTVYWRIPQNRQTIPAPQPVRRQITRLEADDHPALPRSTNDIAPVRVNAPAPIPVVAAEASEDRQSTPPQRQVREPKPSRQANPRKVDDNAGEDP